jgi:hypothetical protein
MEPRKRSRKSGLIAALVGVAALGLTVATTFGANFSAQVGGTSSFQSGTLLLSKTIGAGTPCLSSPNTSTSITTNSNLACTGSDFGAPTNNAPANPVTSTTVTLTNQGSINATTGLTLQGAACSVSGAPYGSSALNPLSTGTDTAGFCGKVGVTIFNGTNCLYPAGAGACPSAATAVTTMSTLASTSVTLTSSLNAGASVAVTFSTALQSATTTNADQGLVANELLTYTLNQ